MAYNLSRAIDDALEALSVLMAIRKAPPDLTQPPGKFTKHIIYLRLTSSSQISAISVTIEVLLLIRRQGHRRPSIRSH